MKSTGLAILVLTIIGCGDRSRGADAPDQTDEPPERCMSGVPCIVNEDCIAVPGSRCNTVLAEPECQTIRCGAEGSSCLDEAQCPEDMLCWSERCGTCTAVPTDGSCVGGQVLCNTSGEIECNGECVDPQSDPRHCGGCNQPVPAEGVCENATPACPRDLTLCGNECADLLDDERNCGACFVRARGSSCFDGDPGCGEELDCDGVCTYPSEPANCGGCDLTCDYLEEFRCPDGMVCRRDTAYCRNARCEMEISTGGGDSCENHCAAAGAECVEAVWDGPRGCGVSAPLCLCAFEGR